MEKVARAQALGASGDKLSYLDNMKKIIEINPYHPFIKELLERVKTNPDKETEESARLLYNVALISSGYYLSETDEFSKGFYNIMSDSLGIPREQETVDLDLEDDEEEPAKEEVKTEEKKEEVKTEEKKEEPTNGNEDPIKIDYNTGENEDVVNTDEVPINHESEL